MAAQPAPRLPSARPADRTRPRDRARAHARPGATAPAPDRALRLERRRREQHWRRRRRDLVEDAAIALVLTLVALIVTAGLGVMALIEVPVAGAVLGSFLVERGRRKRRRPAQRGSRPPGRAGR